MAYVLISVCDVLLQRKHVRNSETNSNTLLSTPEFLPSPVSSQLWEVQHVEANVSRCPANYADFAEAEKLYRTRKSGSCFCDGIPGLLRAYDLGAHARHTIISLS